MKYEVSPILYSKKIDFSLPLTNRAVRYGVHIRFKNIGQKLWFPADLRNQLLILREGNANIKTNSVKSQQPKTCFRGTFNVPVDVSFEGEYIEVLAVELYPESLHLLTGEKASEFTNLFTPVSDTNLCRIGSIEDFDLQITEIDKWISERMTSSATSCLEIKEVLKYARESKGQISVKSISEKVGVHPRTLRRYFLKFIGLTPRAYLLQLRFEETLRKAILNKSLKKLYRAGSAAFYDQPHFINCFRRFAGATPSKIQNLDRSWLEFIVNFES